MTDPGDGGFADARPGFSGDVSDGGRHRAAGDANGTPERSLQQRRDALATANVLRSTRAQLKREIKAGQREVHHVLDDPPACVQTMKVLNLLIAAPAIGRTKAERALRMCGISPVKTIGGLSARQRRDLVWHLESGLALPTQRDDRRNVKVLLEELDRECRELRATSRELRDVLGLAGADEDSRSMASTARPSSTETPGGASRPHQPENHA